MARRPTALDRDIAGYIRALPDGECQMFIESAESTLGAAYAKPEGGMIVRLGGKRITFAPKLP